MIPVALRRDQNTSYDADDLKKHPLLGFGGTWSGNVSSSPLPPPPLSPPSPLEERRALTPGGLGAVRPHPQAGGHVRLPGVLHGRLVDHAVAQLLQRPEVVPQVLHRLDVVLLLRGEDGVEGLQLRNHPPTHAHAHTQVMVCSRGQLPWEIALLSYAFECVRVSV